MHNTPSIKSRLTPPTDRRCIRIDGRLNYIGDTVYIPHLGCNGTILDFVGRHHLTVISHNYSFTIRTLPSSLKHGVGINCSQRTHLNNLDIYYFDNH